MPNRLIDVIPKAPRCRFSVARGHAIRPFRSFVHSFTRSFVHSSIRHSSICLFVHSSFIHLSIRPFAHSPCHLSIPLRYPVVNRLRQLQTETVRRLHRLFLTAQQPAEHAAFFRGQTAEHALLDDPTLVDDQNLIGSPDGGQPVGDHDYRHGML
jgi:hypothetical protein